MFGLPENHIKLIRSVFEKYTDVSKVILYGSRAKGNFRTGSDIDLTMTGEKLDFDTLLRISTELDDLLLPYNIDLSLFNLIDNKELKEHINGVGVVFYERDK